MKKYAAFILLYLFCVVGKAQVKTSASDTTIYVEVDKPALYPAGLAAFSKFINDNLAQAESEKNNIKGILDITFVVEKNGTLSDCKILKGFSPAFNANLVKVIKLAPKWKPATLRGLVVRQQYFVSINYESGEKEPKPNTAGSVKSAAEYPGGLDKFYSYIHANLKYPAKADKLQGKVAVSFAIDIDGTLKDAKIEKSLLPEIDEEVLRLFKASKKWQPGKQNGKVVKQKFIINIPFQ